MSFRITTNGMFHSYRGNLSRANRNLFNTMLQVQTERKFNSYAEDPAAANRAFQMRRSYWNTGNQIDNTNYLLSKFQTGWDALGSIVDGDTEHPGLDGILTSLRGITGTAGAGRSILGQTLMSTAEAIVGAMNVRYGDTYVFAGANGLDVPFTWRTEKDANGNEIKILQYRGIDVDTPDDRINLTELAAELGVTDSLKKERPLTQEQFDALTEDGGAGYASLEGSPDNDPVSNFEEYLQQYRNDHTEKEGDEGYVDDFGVYQKWYETKNGIDYDTGLNLLEYDEAVAANEASDYTKLLQMNNESTLVDIGLGFRLNEDGITINPATAYNSALSGIQILDFGVDDEGYARNIVSLMRELGEIFNRCDDETGDYNKDYPGDEARAEELVVKLRESIGRVQEQHAILDGKSDYLQKNLVQLDDNKFNLNEEILDIEEMDMAAAIQNMMWAQYTYNAALRIGTQILSQSLFDYLG